MLMKHLPMLVRDSHGLILKIMSLICMLTLSRSDSRAALRRAHTPGAHGPRCPDCTKNSCTSTPGNEDPGTLPKGALGHQPLFAVPFYSGHKTGKGETRQRVPGCTSWVWCHRPQSSSASLPGRENAQDTAGVNRF